MVGIVIVSHSKKAAEGIRELAVQMSGSEESIIAAGGIEDGSIGTDAVKISNAIKEADSGKGVVVMVDLGSAVMSSTIAIELLESNLREKVRIANAPILEGTISAAVQASIGDTIDNVLAAAEEARDMDKLM
jgi:dihydroxyacetone kinase phosphotransfer subunit